MPQSLAQIYIHIIFSTYNRLPMIDDPIEDDLHSYISGICHNQKCIPIITKGMSDHVHVLCSLNRSIAVSTLLEEMKKCSSKWIKTKDSKYQKFQWQTGYGAFSVSSSRLDRVRKYIQDQKIHHKVKTFQEEYREFLDAYGIEYDEKYVWG